MAGHSHWAGIKHKKGKVDKQRSKIFSKLSKEITVAAKLGDKDPAMNPRLRSAIQAARFANMPKDNIKRAIEKGSGTGETGALEEIIFEGYGPGGVAILVETMSDNRNRTVSDVRHAFSKFGGNLGLSSGSGPPLAATVISLITFVQIFPLEASCRAFLCFIFAHFE